MMGILMTGPGEITAFKIYKFKKTFMNLGESLIEMVPEVKKVSMGRDKYLKRCRNRDKLYSYRMHKYGKGL